MASSSSTSFHSTLLRTWQFLLSPQEFRPHRPGSAGKNPKECAAVGGRRTLLRTDRIKPNVWFRTMMHVGNADQHLKTSDAHHHLRPSLISFKYSGPHLLLCHYPQHPLYLPPLSVFGLLVNYSSCFAPRTVNLSGAAFIAALLPSHYTVIIVAGAGL